LTLRQVTQLGAKLKNCVPLFMKKRLCVKWTMQPAREGADGRGMIIAGPTVIDVPINH
jgi:hypothetical protein